MEEQVVASVSDTKSKDILDKINEQTEKLIATGLTQSNWKTLKNRLGIVWSEENLTQLKKANVWRKAHARHRYRLIQEANAHLFLVVVLAISPTECTEKSSKEIVERLCCLDDYEKYRFHLEPTDEALFESVAEELGVSESKAYKNFMQVMFPPGS